MHARSEPAPSLLLAWLIGLYALLCLFVYASPHNFTQHNEDRMALYVYDIIENGQWLCPSLAGASLMTKPPLYAWISALASLAVGKLTPWTLYFPSMLSMLGLIIAVFLVGRRYFGWAAGFLAALSLIASPVALEGMATCRYDALFGFAIFLAGIAAFRGWITGQGWTWFWLACAGGALTKGPLAVVLSGAGLLAWAWERRAQPVPLRGSHWLGIALFLLITGGWFILAYLDRGDALIQTLLVRELVAQSVVSDKGSLPLAGLYKTPFYFLIGFLPWSFLTLVALKKVWRQPSLDPTSRRFERFLFVWFIVGLALFALAGHQRARLILPLIPAAALLTGRHVADWVAARDSRRLFKLGVSFSILTLMIAGAVCFLVQPHTRHARRTQGLREMADTLRNTVGPFFPLTYADNPFAFQYFFGRVQPFVSLEEASRLLAGPEAAFIAVQDASSLQKRLDSNAPAIHILQRWPPTGEPVLEIVSNHDRLEWAWPVVMDIGPWQLRLSHAEPVRLSPSELVLRQRQGAGEARITNRTSKRRPLRVKLDEPEIGGAKPRTIELERSLDPGESWTIPFKQARRA